MALPDFVLAAMRGLIALSQQNRDEPYLAIFGDAGGRIAPVASNAVGHIVSETGDWETLDDDDKLVTSVGREMRPG